MLQSRFSQFTVPYLWIDKTFPATLHNQKYLAEHIDSARRPLGHSRLRPPSGGRMEPSRQPSVVRFGTYELGLQSGELRKAGARIRVQQQPLKLLEIMLERTGAVVSRDELRNRIWTDESYGDFDQAVNVAIAKLRAALGDSADNPRYVETLPRRGYRFIADVSEIDTAPGPKPELAASATTSQPAERTKAKRRPWASARNIVVIALVVVAMALTAIWLPRAQSHASSGIRSIAV